MNENELDVQSNGAAASLPSDERGEVNDQTPRPAGDKKKYLIIGGVVVVLIIVGVLLVLFSGLKTSPQSTQNTTEFDASEYVLPIWDEDPWLSRTPKPYTLGETVEGKQVTVEKFGVSFTSPWGAPAENEGGDAMRGLSFEDGTRMLISAHDGSYRDALLENAEGETRVEYKKTLALIEDYLPREPEGVDYVRFLIEATPEKVKSASTKKEAETYSKAVILKQVFLLPERQPYSFATDHLEGFIFKHLKNSSPHVQMWHTNGEVYEIMLQPATESKVTKKELDTVISSFKVGA